MSNPLLQRQIRLLEYLTSTAAIFENGGLSPSEDGLDGFDLDRLGLEARFSFEKRLEKIGAVFRRTFAICSWDWTPILRKFVEAYPPADIGRFENARQFLEFLSKHKGANLEPPWLLDVAACELACARARRHRDIQRSTLNHAALPAIRRAPGAAILRCDYNVRAVFEDRPGGAVSRGETLLAILVPPETGRPEIFEIGSLVFELLSACEEWTGPATLGVVSRPELLIEDLAKRGLLELRS